MTHNPKVNRRDFLRMGGLAAVSLPIITKVGTVHGEDVLESEEAYGGFLIRQQAENEDPFETNADFERMHAKDVIFSRMVYDEELIERINAVELVFKPNDPGYSQLDVALGAGAAYCALIHNTGSPLMGTHDGLLSLTPSVFSKDSITFEERWDHSHLSEEEVANTVKKAAKFLGASLVGIAPFDERFIYTGYYDAIGGTGVGGIDITEVIVPELPEGQVSADEAGQLIKAELETWDGEEIKAFILDVLETTPPELMPADTPPIGMVKVLPASQFKDNLSKFTTMPASLLTVMVEKLGMDIEVAQVDLGESATPRYLEDGTLAIPETMKHVIVLAFEMDDASMQAAPTAQGDLGTMDGYSKMAITAGSLAQFIRKLGYNAIPCGNNTGISVPQAVQAGLGEGGRNGILITPKYGPRVRLSKVITDLPMANDKPIRFGVEEFCKVCKKCADMCPTQAIPHGDKSFDASTKSSFNGLKKWSVNAEECYFGWTANGSGCGQCIRVCPFNKPDSWLHDVTRVLIGAKVGAVDDLLVKLDDASGFGAEEPTFDFWETDEFIHIKS